MGDKQSLNIYRVTIEDHTLLIKILPRLKEMFILNPLGNPKLIRGIPGLGSLKFMGCEFVVEYHTSRN